MDKNSPFALSNALGYERWRARKLEQAKGLAVAPVIQLNDAMTISATAIEALKRDCHQFNVARYKFRGAQTRTANEQVHAVAAALGLRRVDRTTATQPDGIARISAHTEKHTREYIPFTNRTLNWHTDGYYNSSEHQIRGVIMQCVSPAARGGENVLLDTDLAYISLRDENPDWIEALMTADAMTIPANIDETGGIIRPACAGPVFSVDGQDGTLHMRYTARTRSVKWRSDSLTGQAAAYLRDYLSEPPDHSVCISLSAGEGLVSNNVLHTRVAFEDHDQIGKRVHLRARYYDRIAGT